MTTKLGWKENHGIQNIGTEDCQGNKIADQRQVLKIWKNYSRAKWLETLKVETQKEMDEDKKGPYILHSEMEKAIMEMMMYLEIYSNCWEKMVSE